MPNRFLTRRHLAAFVAAAGLGALWLPLRAGGTADTVEDDGLRFEDTATHVHIVGAARISGDDDQLAVTLSIDPGFHINANPASSDFLIPTTLTVTERAPLRVVYPEPVRFKPKFVDETIDVYEGTILISAFFPKGALGSFASLHGSVTAQACTDQYCLPPAELPLLAE